MITPITKKLMCNIVEGIKQIPNMHGFQFLVAFTVWKVLECGVEFGFEVTYG